MKVLTSQEAFAYKQQLETIREQMRQIEERGVYDIAGNIIKPSDRRYSTSATDPEEETQTATTEKRFER